MPHGALDVSKVTGLPERVFIDAHAPDTDNFTMFIRDWDERGTELGSTATALSSMTASTDADVIALGAQGPPTMIDVQAPGVPFTVADPDDTNDGGDGLPGSEWEFDFSISRSTSVSAAADNATAMFRIVDPEFFIDRKNLRNEADDMDSDDQYNQVGVKHDDTDVSPTGNPFDYIDHESSIPPITFQALKIRTGSAPRPISVGITGTPNCGNNLSFSVGIDSSSDAPTLTGGTITYDWKFFDDATSCPAPATRDLVGWASPVDSTSASPTVKLLRCTSTASDGLLRGSVQITKTISSVAYQSEKFYFTVDPDLGVSTPTFTSTNSVFTQDYLDSNNNSFAAMALIPSSGLDPNSTPTTDYAGEYAIVFRDNTSSTHSALKVTVYDPVNDNFEANFPVTIANADTAEKFGDISIDATTHGIIIAWIDTDTDGVEGVLGRWPLTQANAFTAVASLGATASGQISCALRKGTNTDWAIAFYRKSNLDAAISMGTPTWGSPPSWGTPTTAVPSSSGDVGEYPTVCEIEGNKFAFAYRDNGTNQLKFASANGTSPSSAFTAHVVLSLSGNQDGKDFSMAKLGEQIGVAFRSGAVDAASLKLVVTNPVGSDPDDPASESDWLNEFTIDDPGSETTGFNPHLSMVDSRPVIVYQQADSDLSDSDLRMARACAVPLVKSIGQWTLATVAADGTGSTDDMGFGPMVFPFSTSRFGILHHIRNDSDTGTVEIRRSSAGW